MVTRVKVRGVTFHRLQGPGLRMVFTFATDDVLVDNVGVFDFYEAGDVKHFCDIAELGVPPEYLLMDIKNRLHATLH